VKLVLTFASLVLLSPAPAHAQLEIPGNPVAGPGKPPVRAVGGGIDPGATVENGQAANRSVRYVTHIILHDTRLWTSADGKPLEAKLIAFEDLVAETPPGAAEPKVAAPPAHPTLLRNGAIRLLVDRKPVILPLDRLSSQDQQLIHEIETALAKKAAAAR
jgi:hypothetical protein